MQVKSHQINANARTVTLNGKELLFSYDTLVGVEVNGSRYFQREDKAASVTTGRHISKWLAGRSAQEVSATKLQELAEV